MNKRNSIGFRLEYDAGGSKRPSSNPALKASEGTGSKFRDWVGIEKIFRVYDRRKNGKSRVEAGWGDRRGSVFIFKKKKNLGLGKKEFFKKMDV
jgi:hypothetical protein